MAKISIIIPIYNVENYLKICLDSIINQTLKDIEIICINDGSPDNSINILEEYAQKDKRVKIISKENEGAAIARNIGMKYAKGEYISFIDSDDYIPHNALEKLYNNAKSNYSDVVIFKTSTFIKEETLNYSNNFFKIDREITDKDFNNYTFTYNEIKKYIMHNAFAPWSKLYKKSFLDEYDDFIFPEGLIFEDIPFHIKILLRAKRISFVPEYLYNYRISNSNSVSNIKSNREDIFTICNIVEEFLKEEDFFEEFKKDFYKFKIDQILKYIISFNSENYFSTAKLELSKINLEDISKNRAEKILLILSSKNLKEYKIKDYEYNIKNLKSANKKLRDENKNMKKQNKDLISSNSWKITKPLRKFIKIIK